jgi:hypothetical protein
MVLDLLAHLLDQHLHVHGDAGQFQRRRLGAQRVGLAVQFLDQEVQPLADLAALLDQALDLVQVGGQPGQFLGDVDADGEGGGLGQGAVLRRFGRGRCLRPGPSLPSSVPGSAGAAAPPAAAPAAGLLAPARAAASGARGACDPGEAPSRSRARPAVSCQHLLRQRAHRLGPSRLSPPALGRGQAEDLATDRGAGFGIQLRNAVLPRDTRCRVRTEGSRTVSAGRAIDAGAQLRPSPA